MRRLLPILLVGLAVLPAHGAIISGSSASASSACAADGTCLGGIDVYPGPDWGWQVGSVTGGLLTIHNTPAGTPGGTEEDPGIRILFRSNGPAGADNFDDWRYGDLSVSRFSYEAGANYGSGVFVFGVALDDILAGQTLVNADDGATMRWTGHNFLDFMELRTTIRDAQSSATPAKGSIGYGGGGDLQIIDRSGSIVLDSPSGTKIGATGTPITLSVRAAIEHDFASIAAGTCGNVNVTTTGAAVGAECAVGLPSATVANLIGGCVVTAADTVNLRVCNQSGAPIDPAAGLTYSVRVFNP